MALETTKGFDAALRKHDRNDNVATIAAGIMDKDSALMKRADAQGRAFGAQRGLLNSSMAGQAGRAAALDHVVPMASQTATQEFQKNIAGLAHGQNLELSEQRFRTDRALKHIDHTFLREQNKLDRSLTRDIERGRITSSEKMAALDRQLTKWVETGRIKSTEKQAMLDRSLKRELEAGRLKFEKAQAERERQLKMRLQSGALAHEAALAAHDRALKYHAISTDRRVEQARLSLQKMEGHLERASREKIAGMELNRNDRSGVEAMLSNTFQQFEEAQRSILSNEQLPAAERNKLLENSKKLLQTKVDYVSSLYSKEYKWPSNPFKASSSRTTSSTRETAKPAPVPSRSSLIPSGVTRNATAP